MTKVTISLDEYAELQRYRAEGGDSYRDVRIAVSEAEHAELVRRRQAMAEAEAPGMQRSFDRTMRLVGPVVVRICSAIAAVDDAVVSLLGKERP